MRQIHKLDVDSQMVQVEVVGEENVALRVR